jgi:tRNA nucleotidyltransferase (CCA-adding enzyme)
MRQMSASGELDALVPERVWRELERLLGEPTPRAGIELLRECGALRIVLPELDALFGVPQSPKWHPEVDTGEHVLLALQVAAGRAAPVSVRFAVLMHDLGKALTPRSEWPKHIAHEARGVPAIESLCQRLRVPQEHRDLALLASRFHTHVHRGLELRATTLLEVLESADAFRRPGRFAELLEVCECDARGRLGFADQPYPQRARFEQALEAASATTLQPDEREGLVGAAIGERLRRKRLAAIEALRA